MLQTKVCFEQKLSTKINLFTHNWWVVKGCNGKWNMLGLDSSAKEQQEIKWEWY
jgi:hypothetical protein